MKDSLESMFRPFGKVTFRQVKRPAGRGLVYLILFLIAITTLLPLVWMVSTSLKSESQLSAFPPIVFPIPPRWRNYADAVSAFPYLTFLRNTIILTGVNLVGQVLVSALVAYGFAWFRFPAREHIFIILVASMALPRVAILVPSFVLFKYLGWLDSYLPLIVPSILGGSAYHIFLLRQFFLTLPSELVDAARIDGCSPLGVFWWIILPLSKPVLAVITIFSFVGTWNDFMGPLLYINSESRKTLALGLAYFQTEHLVAINQLMAATFISLLPVLIVLFLGQRMVFSNWRRYAG